MTFIDMQDVRYALRAMSKNPGYAAVAVFTLMLGIGANAAIFSLVNSILLRPLPYEIPERLVIIREKSKKQPAMSVAYPNFVDYRDQSQVFENVTAYRMQSMALTGAKEPERLDACQVSHSFFDVLGVPPSYGRTFLPEEDFPGSNPTVVVSEELWQRQFDSNSNIIGQAIMLNGRGYTVVGVMPARFRFPRIAQIWTPIGLSASNMVNRGIHQVSMLARVKPGMSVEQARTELETIASRLESLYPTTNQGVGVTVDSLSEQVVRDIRPTLLVLLGAVGFVLLIACANVANLLLARAASRQKEISIRTALGASRSRIVRQLLTESLVLSIAGGILGVVLAYFAIDILKAITPVDGNIPRVKEINIDSRVLGFTLIISLLTGIVFGLVPALQTSKFNLTDSLKEGGRSSGDSAHRNRFRSLLVVTEIAMAVVLLVGGALMIKSFVRLMQNDPGFNPDNVLVAEISLPAMKYPDAQKQTSFYQQLLGRIQTVPGVQAAGMINPLPIGGASNQAPTIVENKPAQAGEEIQSDFLVVSPDYFKAMSIPLLKGRAFTEQDADPSPSVVIIDEKAAETLWPDEDALGKRLSFENPEVNGARVRRWREVVGVVRHVKHYGLSSEARHQLYVPYLQAPHFYRGILPPMSLVMRCSAAPRMLVNAVRSEVLGLDGNLPIYNVNTMDEILFNSVARTRLAVWLMTTFAIVALILAAVGVYGVLSYSVTQRTHEIGVRMALGAQRSDVLRLMIRQGMALAALGLALGIGSAYFLTPVMANLLWGVSATDTTTFVIIAALLGSVAMIACYIPARRATKVDPIIALRYE